MLGERRGVEMRSWWILLLCVVMLLVAVAIVVSWFLPDEVSATEDHDMSLFLKVGSSTVQRYFNTFLTTGK
jgi:flagellar basal body-associated protein FliL